MATPERVQLLTNALRAAASQAAEFVGGGASLLFATLPGEDTAGVPRLRAAAGFETLDDARGAAGSVSQAVSDCIASQHAVTLGGMESIGARGAAGVLILPLKIEEHTHGALVVCLPAAIQAPTPESLSLLAATTAIHIDHMQLGDEVEALRNASKDDADSEDADELLRLSETLFAQDIELMRNNEKLGQIEKIKSDFIEKMSKELRTPLNSIIESTISVLAGENENLSDDAKQSLRAALDEGTIFQRTLQNILDLWRIKQGEMPVEIQDLNFSEVVDEAIFSVQDTLKGSTVTIQKKIAPNFPKIKADLAKVNQLLFLLVDNAAKFTPEGTIEIRAEMDGNNLRCHVKDTGIGICNDDQQYIFDDFFQVDDHASSQYRGAGLGLSLVRDLLSLLDGSCMIDSEPGSGTTATFEIPVQISG